MHFRIGTRGSRLALAQAEAVKRRLEAAYGEDGFEIVVLSSRGDRDRVSPLTMLGAGAFVRDLEERLLAGEVDLLVHSMKDLPAETPPGLTLAKAWTRADARDALVSRSGLPLADLPRGAVVATGSVRRTRFLRTRRPDLRFVPIRGNVDTRLARLFGTDPAPTDAPPLDALVLACAGLDRLGLGATITERLDPAWMIPAPNQGQLAIELRAADVALKAKVDALGDDAAERVAQAERAFLRSTGATCRDAVAAYAETTADGELRLRTFFERTEPPRVTLVGAGPGDPGLITVKGLAALRAADAIVYDRLVAPELLREARRGCELRYVGKTPAAAGDAPSVTQREINELLAALAARHAHVVRLKGGDPFVFGRGGEEVAFLRSRGIACEVIPGVSAAIAAPAAAGIPLTHRGAATAFRVIAARGERFAADELDYASMRDGRTTLVFMMGFGQLAEIAAGLVAAGRAPSSPAAVVSGGTTAGQRTVRGPLASIAAEAAAHGLSAPAVLVVGDVAAFGRRCLVAKVGDSPSALADRLRAAGAEVTEITVGRVRPLPGALTPAEAGAADWLVVTSANAVDTLSDAVVAAFRAKGAQVAAIGPATAAAARRRQLAVRLVASVANSPALLRELVAVVRPEETVLRLLPEGVADSLAALASSCRYRAVATYANDPVPPPPLARSDFDEIYATSPSCRNRLPIR
ncbi:MAG: uroporphyrinogen-III C-methyltransferase [Kiritimatiellia bacterium]